MLENRSLACCLALAALTACHGPAAPPADAPAPLVPIEGVVLDGIDERPLAGVRVRARDVAEAVAVTDRSGRFSINLPEGTHRLWLDRQGYVPGQRANVRVSALGERSEATVGAVQAHLFPRAPSLEAMQAYFARQPVRRHRHPAHERPASEPDEDVGAVRMAGGDAVALPDTIRVWRSGGTALQPTAANDWADNSCHADAVVLELPREEYVKGVIPHEWFPSWHPEALRAGAIAARTYAVNWWRRGGRWDCADVDDGTVTQVYRDDRSDTTNEAVDATAGQVVTRAGETISTEYSAENGDPTAFDVAEPTCTGEALFGHGRGMCQWGTHRWASAICANPPCDWSAFGGAATPRDHVWMVEHYYPGACVAGEGVAAPPCQLIPAAGGIVDDAGPCFTAFGPSLYWRTEADGWEGGLHWTNAFQASAPSNWARWRLHFETPGRYRVEAYVDGDWGVWSGAQYEVTHAGGSTDVLVDHGAADGWVELGVFDFDADGTVALYDDEDVVVPADQRIVADAIRLTPDGAPPMDGGPGADGGPGGPSGARQVGAPAVEVTEGEGLEGGCAVAARGRAPDGSSGAFACAAALLGLLARRRRAR